MLLLAAALAGADPFTDWLDVPVPVAAGFHVPVADAAAAGRVALVTQDVIEVEHVWYENHEPRRVVVRYTGITPGSVAPGDPVSARQPLGTGRPVVSFRVDGGTVDPAGFVAERGSLPVPANEPELLLISHAAYEARLYRRGVEVARYPVSFGQAEGQKRRRGDNRTPKGMYHVVSMSRGPFTGPVGAYYGGHWIKLDYPNPWDAAYGAANGWVGADVVADVREAWARRALTRQDTVLGSGIGLHGWAFDWPLDGSRHLSWGCIVFQPADVAKLYAQLRVGAMVVLL